jgi:hypothetical protein
MKLTLEKHYSPDRDSTYYYIIIGNMTIYSSANLQECEARLEHIKEVGIVAYIKEISIIKEVLVEYELPEPEFEKSELPEADDNIIIDEQ